MKIKVSESTILKKIEEMMATCNRLEVEWMKQEQVELYERINKMLEG